jgi:hypothetical protein
MRANVRGQAATEYILGTLVVLCAIAGVIRYSNGVSRAYGGGAAELGSVGARLGGGGDAAFRVPGSMRVETTAGEGTLTFVRRTASGWATVPVGGVITNDMEFAVEVVLHGDPGVASAQAFIEWQGDGSPRGLTAVAVGERREDGRSVGEPRRGVSIDVARVSDGMYRSAPLRLSECLARIR